MSDVALIADLVRAGVAAELVARVATAIAEARAEGALHQLSKYRSQGADRQARWRERHNARNVNNVSDVTVTDADTAVSRVRAFSMGEESSTTPDDPTDHHPPKRRNVTSNGSRLPEGFTCSPDCRGFGLSLGLTDAEIDVALEEFRDYWRGVPGQKGRKTDWEATFRNQLRRVAGNKKSRAGPRLNGHAKPYRTNTLMDAVLESQRDAASQEPGFDDSLA